MFGIKKELLTHKKADYADYLSQEQMIIDCSLGTNPYTTLLPTPLIPTEEISVIQYPENEKTVKDAIIDYFSEHIELNYENILCTCGSMGGLMTINRAFLAPGKTVLGVAPQFTANIDDILLHGASYKTVDLQKSEDFRFSSEVFLDALEKVKNGFIYVDNPNNPTGQIIPLQDIRLIVQCARDNDTMVLIDEAYGDYMSHAESAVCLLNEFDNLLVTRTFSKGLGGAGIRLGYILSAPWCIKALKKIHTPFSVNVYALAVAADIMKNTNMSLIREQVRLDKESVFGAIKNLNRAYTSEEVPIGLYYIDDETVDLEKIFASVGMRVVGCATYRGLNKNYVRINLNENITEMMTLLLKVDSFFD